MQKASKIPTHQIRIYKNTVIMRPPCEQVPGVG